MDTTKELNSNEGVTYMETLKPALSEIMAASNRLKSILHHTELDLSSTFSRMTGGNIYLKCENRQKTGSFKIRMV